MQVTAAGRTFVEVCADGHVSASELARLRASARGLTGKQRSAAAHLIDLVAHDRNLDRRESTRARELLGFLGVSAQSFAHTTTLPPVNVDIEALRLTLDLRHTPASCRAAYTLSRPAPKRSILEVVDARIVVAEVLADGRPVPFTQSHDRLRFDGGGAHTLEIRYELKAGSEVGATGLLRRAGEAVTLLWPENVTTLFPGDNRVGKTLTVDLEVHTADHVDISATGRPMSRKAGYARFKVDKPIPAYALGLATLPRGQRIADTRGKRTLEWISRPGAARATARRKHFLDVAHRTHDTMQAWFGDTVVDPLRALAEVASPHGGMEHVGCVHIGRDTARTVGGGAETVAHEVIHQWFGNSLRIEAYADMWLSEGFTTYLTARAEQHRAGDARYLELMQANLDLAVEDLSGRRRSAARYPLRPAYDHVAPEAIFDFVTYCYGAWVLAFLEHDLGRDSFDAVMRSWFEVSKGRATDTDAFFAHLSEKTGRDFAEFRARWVDALPTPGQLRREAAKTLRDLETRQGEH